MDRWMMQMARCLKDEDDLKIICIKHSATFIIVEQTADAGPMFKGIKCYMKEMAIPNSSGSSIYSFLETEFKNFYNQSKKIKPGCE